MGDALRPVAQYRQQHDLDHNIIGRSTHLEEIRRMITCGLGIGPLPVHVVDQDIRDGTLWRLPPYDNPPAVDIHLVTNPSKRLNRAEAAFIETLKGEIINLPFASRVYRQAQPNQTGAD